MFYYVLPVCFAVKYDRRLTVDSDCRFDWHKFFDCVDSLTVFDDSCRSVSSVFTVMFVWLYFDCILTVLWLYFDCILTVLWLYCDCIVTVFFDCTFCWTLYIWLYIWLYIRLYVDCMSDDCMIVRLIDVWLSFVYLDILHCLSLHCISYITMFDCMFWRMFICTVYCMHSVFPSPAFWSLPIREILFMK
jgi:hypothetical protein